MFFNREREMVNTFMYIRGRERETRVKKKTGASGRLRKGVRKEAKNTVKDKDEGE